MKTTELCDEQWEHLEPLLPPPRHRGRPRADDRKTLNGILYVLRTGCRWQDVPREYGSLLPARADSRDTEDFLRVPLEVEGAARILTEHFDPEDLYRAMVEVARQRG